VIRFLVIALLLLFAARFLRRILQPGGGASRADRRRRGSDRGDSPSAPDRYPGAVDADFEDLDRR
jgi:hypothetical protein